MGRNGLAWLASGATVQDITDNLSRSGEVILTALPETRQDQGQRCGGLWIACQLIPLGEQLTLPTIRRIHIAREIVVPEQQVTHQRRLHWHPGRRCLRPAETRRHVLSLRTTSGIAGWLLFAGG